MSRKIFFLGNALLDVSIICDHAYLEKYKLKRNNSIEARKGEHDVLFNEVLQNADAFFSPGGSAQNSARVAQWVMSGMHLTKQTAFVGCVGDDEYGLKLEKEVQNAGVHVLYDIVKGAPTGMSVGLIVEDCRSLVARLGAASLFNPSYLTSPEVQQEIHEAKIIYVEGFFFSHNLLCTVELAKYAEQNAKIFSLNLSAEYIAEDNFGTLNTCVNLSGLVFGNKDEVEYFIRKSNLEFATIEECALALASFGSKSRIAIITQGQGPIVLAQLNSVKLFEVPPVADIADSIGCGDAFVGGVLAALALRKPIDTAIHYGIHCSKEIIRSRGCTLPIKHFDYDHPT